MKLSEMFGRKMQSKKMKPEEIEEMRKLIAEYDSQSKELIVEDKKEDIIAPEIKQEEPKIEQEPIKEEVKVEPNAYDKLVERLDKLEETLRTKAQPEPKPEEIQKSGSEKDTVLPINTVSQYTNNASIKYTSVK